MLPEMPAQDPHVDAAAEEKRRERLRTVVNFATSAAFHLGLILITLFIVFPPAPKPEPLVLKPTDDIIYTPQPRMTPSKQNPKGSRNDPRRRAARVRQPDPHMPFVPAVPNPKGEPFKMSGIPDNVPKVGVGPDPWGEGHVDGGIFEITRTARRVVFVIDRSGSMFDFIDRVRVHMIRAIDRMRPYQKFELIFFNETHESWRRGLVRATGPNKRAARAFIHGVITEGQTKPGKAIQDALALKPDLVIILSDGEFDTKVIDLVAKLNRGKEKTQIDTFFAYGTHGGSSDNLRRIAEQNGGRHRRIGSDDWDAPAAEPAPRRQVAPMPVRVYPVAYTVDR